MLIFPINGFWDKILRIWGLFYSCQAAKLFFLQELPFMPPEVQQRVKRSGKLAVIFRAPAKQASNLCLSPGFYPMKACPIFLH